ncbi:hypothetical protein F5B20DRAFT_584485 [Whalleya microplaca]|nr:hypothetical protein F5B20DRAFT_584485 [Whalleya microplaca]
MATLQRFLRPETLQAHRKPLLIGTAAALATAPLLTYTYKNYRAWLALGRGGVPYHFLGWLAQATLHLIARSDTRVPAPYRPEDLEPLYGSAVRTSFFTSTPTPTPLPLPQRKGSRPVVPTPVAPQRQTSQRASPAQIEAQNAFLEAVAQSNAGLVETKPSVLEGPSHTSLWLRKGDGQAPLPRHLGGNPGEFVHVHPEGSTHCMLSPADAAALIEAGWAERHKLSGARVVGAPWGYVLVYAPRDEGEFAFWKSVVGASVRFVLDGRGEAVVPE